MLCFEYLLAILIFHLLNPPTGLELVISHHCGVGCANLEDLPEKRNCNAEHGDLSVQGV